ncbi:MAG TPA: response regulator transcription factor [Thermoanaerobaculaceae bacterium]|nr:response regulator transcription factor [Thermoanaerobaculaceae bacterium]HRS16507.1 response regulator transcription factor [Thermoanaerobaculaceae bacterium]
MSDSAETILVVEDDRALREGLALNFGLRGYRVVTAADGAAGLAAAFDARPDLVVLDLMLPALDGLEILAALREREVDVPVLILSARGRVADKVRGLGLGADDYLAKPFELPELLARVEALLRRRRAARRTASPISFGDVVVDPAAHRVTVAGRDVPMSAREFELLHLLAASPGRVHTREAILERVWGFDFDGTARTVDNFIRALRRKIERDPSRPRHIVTVRNVGYRLEP